MTLLLLALRNVLRNRRRSLVTIAAIAVGLMAVNLFGGYIANVYTGLQLQAVSGERLGHLTIYKQGMLTLGKISPKKYMFDREEIVRLKKVLSTLPDVKLVSPRVTMSGLISNGKASTIFIGEGIVAEDAEMLRGDLAADAGGKLDAAKNYGIAISSDLAELLQLKEGDETTLLTTTIDGQANAMDVQIGSVFNTGNINTNDKYLLATFAFTQLLLDTESVERFIVLLDDVNKTDALRVKIIDRLTEAGFAVEVKTWQELSSFYTSVRDLFNMIFSFIASIVFVVAAMSIANAMSMSVIERTREIGTLKAMGMKQRAVVGLFVCEAVWLATIGVLLGLIFTLVTAFIVNHAGITYVPPNSSYSVALLVDIDWLRIEIVSVVVIILALLSALLPAWRGARREIVDALMFT